MYLCAVRSVSVSTSAQESTLHKVNRRKRKKGVDKVNLFITRDPDFTPSNSSGSEDDL